MQALSESPLAKPYSLFTAPQILRRPLLFWGKQKAGMASSLRINIQFSTRFWSNRMRIAAAWARVVVPAGSRVPSSWPLIKGGDQQENVLYVNMKMPIQKIAPKPPQQQINPCHQGKQQSPLTLFPRYSQYRQWLSQLQIRKIYRQKCICTHRLYGCNS